MSGGRPLEELAERLHGWGVEGIAATSLEVAFTHPSWAAENAGAEHYERLEFLGDAVVNLAAAALLHERFDAASEGVLSRLRIELVNARSLARAAREMDLGSYAKLGVGEERAAGRERENLLADLFESLVAAVYLSAGFEVASAFVRARLAPLIPSNHDAMVCDHDDKGRLQRWTQARTMAAPTYRVSGPEGDDPPLYRAVVTLPDGRVAEGSGRRKKWAEQAAARAALEAYAPAEHQPPEAVAIEGRGAVDASGDDTGA